MEVMNSTWRLFLKRRSRGEEVEIAFWASVTAAGQATVLWGAVGKDLRDVTQERHPDGVAAEMAKARPEIGYVGIAIDEDVVAFLGTEASSIYSVLKPLAFALAGETPRVLPEVAPLVRASLDALEVPTTICVTDELLRTPKGGGVYDW